MEKTLARVPGRTRGGQRSHPLRPTTCVIKRFFNLDTNAYQAGALPVKTKELMGLVASLVLRCDDCIRYHVRQCARGGLRGKVQEAFAVGLVVGGSIVIPHLRRANVRMDGVQRVGQRRCGGHLSKPLRNASSTTGPSHSRGGRRSSTRASVGAVSSRLTGPVMAWPRRMVGPAMTMARMSSGRSVPWARSWPPWSVVSRIVVSAGSAERRRPIAASVRSSWVRYAADMKPCLCRIASSTPK